MSKLWNGLYLSVGIGMSLYYALRIQTIRFSNNKYCFSECNKLYYDTDNIMEYTDCINKCESKLKKR